MSELPMKTRKMESHHFNSHKWDNLEIRDGDIIVTTSYKSGTTWMQNIILSLEYQGKQIPDNAFHLCPWLDLRVPPIEVQQPGLDAIPQDSRRQLKTHLRLDALTYSPKAKYIYVGRDGRDQFVSLYNHYKNGNDLWYHMLNDSPGLVGDRLPYFQDAGYDESSLFDDWISKGWPAHHGETDGYPFWSIFDHASTWWQYRHLPNIKFIHFQDMLDDLPGSIREIAEFVGIPIQEEFFHDIVHANTFETMKANVDSNPLTAGLGHIFVGGGATFLNKGTNGRWRGLLSEAQLLKYDDVVKAKWTPNCASWFEKGKASGVDPSVM